MKFIVVSFLRKDLIGMCLIMWFKNSDVRNLFMINGNSIIVFL